MRAGGAHSKGTRFEREVCKALSLWISQGTREDVFWRSAMSGGRATVRAKMGIQLRAQAGDISPISALGEVLLDRFVLECKAYKDLDVLQGIVKDNGILHGFWKTHRLLGTAFSRIPMLIARQNMMPTFCLMPHYALQSFQLSEDHVVAILPRWDCVMILFDAFLREAGLPQDVCVVVPTRIRL